MSKTSIKSLSSGFERRHGIPIICVVTRDFTRM